MTMVERNQHSPPPVRLFDSQKLVPTAWAEPKAPYYCFNPAITLFRGQRLMIYRVVTADGRRRQALCRLTANFQVVPESVVPFSDGIENGSDWHADARFCTIGDRLFVHYNDGARRGRTQNHIYLVEIDPEHLWPIGPARELVLDEGRRPVEKNWMLFAHEGKLWAIYSIAPQVVLHVTLGTDGPVVCRRVYAHEWDVKLYAARYGELRGGTPPVRVGDHYISYFHSSFMAHPLRRLWRLLGKVPSNLIHYVAGVYCFAAAPPFAPLALHPKPLLLPPRLPRRYPALHPRVEYSVYPCGVILEDSQWHITFGARNEYCCLTTLAADNISRLLSLRLRETN